MSYSKQETIKMVMESIKEPKWIYKGGFINYRGKTSDSREYYTEVTAKELLNNNILGLLQSIHEIVRASGYRTNSHDGVVSTGIAPGSSNRIEERYALNMYNKSKDGINFDEIGTIIDYQIPLKNSKADLGLGKIDLISKTQDYIWLHELKIGKNKETLLRCVLEIATYYQLLSKSTFINSYSEFKGYTVDKIKKGILIQKGSSQAEELEEMKSGKREHLYDLMKILDVEAFIIEEADQHLTIHKGISEIESLQKMVNRLKSYSFCTIDEYLGMVAGGEIVKKENLVDDIQFQLENPSHPLASDFRFGRIKYADQIRDKAKKMKENIPDETLLNIHEILFDCCAAVRLSIAQALSYIGTEASIPYLKRLLDEEPESKMVREGTREALSECITRTTVQ